MKPFFKKLIGVKSRPGRERNLLAPRDSTESGSRTQHESRGSLPTPRSIPTKGQYGLIQLDTGEPRETESSNHYSVDIVAIHGLGGDVHDTWTHPKTGTFWLQELLPESMPGSRIFSYGYPSKIFLSPSTGQIRHYAGNLLSCLLAARQQDIKPRPIIYICHSLGGIVFKQAMNIAFNQDYTLWEWSKGVMFLGTPHRGSASADLATLLGNIANAVWFASGAHRIKGGVTTSLLRTLSSSSNELSGIGEMFTQRASALSIETFYETLITQPVGTVIVEDSSAILGVAHETCTPMYADHRGLCRFESQNSQNYKLVLSSLMRLADEAIKEPKAPASSVNTGRSLDEAEKHCVELLNTLDIFAYESRLDRRADGTLCWVTENPQYSMWLWNDEIRLLLVTGDAGCGKTILSSYVIRCLTESLPPRGLVCRFFCSGQIDDHCDAKVIMRSIIYQIVRRRKRLLRLVRRALDLQGSHLFDRFDALWDLFVEILHQKNVESVSIVIDAIDECDERVQRMITERTVQLLKSTTVPSVKFFLTSRPSTPAVFTINENVISHVRLSLEEKHKAISQDVSLVIRQRLEAMVTSGKCEQQTRIGLERILIRNADRTFLWVSLVLHLIEQRRYFELSDLPNIASQLPKDLTKLYLNLLHSIPAENKNLAGKLLRIVVASARPLNIDEIRLLLVIRPSHHTISALEAEPAISRLESIRMILGPLIRVYESKVYLVHQSLRDFLINLATDESSPLSEQFGIDLQHETLMLVESCIRYLALDDFETDVFNVDRRLEDDSPKSPFPRQREPDPEDEAEHFSFNLFDDPIFKEQHVLDAEACIRVSSDYNLFDYAATYWAPKLAQNSEGASVELHHAAKALCESRTYQHSNWFRYFWALNMIDEPYPKVTGSLIISAFFGLSSTLEIVLTDSHLDVREQLEPAIYWASRRGHDICVERLLREPDIRTESCYVNGQSPLLGACEYGHLDCAEALISSGYFNVNESGPGGRSPLSLSSGSGFDDIVRLLLAQSEIDVDLPDRSGASSLFSAVASNSNRTISLLLADPRLNPNHIDTLGRNALSWAAAEGYLESTKMLLKDPRIDAAAKDVRGRTALSYAAQNGHFEIVALLVRSGRLDLSEMDNEKRNAISWAAQQSMSRCLHYLVQHDPEGADREDKSGWTPLAWALDPPGFPENVSILIQSDYVDINRKDRVGRSALSFAAGYGLTRIVQLLSRARGIEVDSTDKYGRTPLSHAASAGSLDVVQLLVDTNGVDINAQDANGRTSLSWAAGEGNAEVVNLFLNVPGVEIESRDTNGRTPLDFARLYDHRNVVQLFEQVR